jgi:four helix bundle protein
MTYEEWERQVPEAIKADPVWQFYAYRKGSFLYDLVGEDCETLMRDPRGRAIVEQIIRSAGSICANIEEGYGRGYGKDRNHFLRISVGSARETKGWYYRARRLLSPEVLKHRLALIDEVISLLVTELARQHQFR